MPDSTEDARKVQDHIDRIFDADPHDRAEAIRRLFVEVLDFHGAVGQVSLAGGAKGAELPDFAERIASLGGVRVLWVALASKRVNKRDAAEAARLIERDLGEDLLLVCTNRDEKLGDADQLHLILPDFGNGTTPTLRRMTVERGLPQRTAFEQIACIYSEADRRPVRQALAEAFEVEPVTKSFFEEYKRIFDAAKEHVTGIEDEEEHHLFVQTLFNRLLFVHFLSRKGWLTFNNDTEYLNALWQDYQATPGETNFHRDRLRRLFFDGLSNPESQFRDYPDIGKVQFLNGGLFEETSLDKQPGVSVPDEAIQPLLFQLFLRFNFTVMESTPFDVEVAVDPEMLGKVFEELVTGRHESGSYYTPRPVVSFMCREALKGYLEGCDTGLDVEAISEFVNEQRTEGVIGVAEARKVAEALSEVTVVDPACGSGAYLLGMMQELVDLQTALFRAGADPKSLHALKLEIIERNLHGVDNDGFAVNIAMLRLWLALAIEDEPPIDPLPNLNFKIVCGDSLLGPDPSGLSFDRVTIEQSGLGRLKSEYLRESNSDRKERLLGEIEAAREQVRANLGGTAVPEDVIDWRVEFAEVFASGGGFDIAIANPPYERMEQISDKGSLEQLYPNVYAGRADYYVYFYNRAIQSLRDGGTLAFISSNKYMRAGYGKKLRGYLTTRLALGQVIDFGDLPIFTATAYPSVVVGRKTGSDDDLPLRVADLVTPIRRKIAQNDQPLTTETVNRTIDGLPTLLSEHAVPGYPRSMLGEDGWVLEDLAFIRLFERLMNMGTPLGEFVEGRIFRGVVTGLNEAFVIDQAKRNSLVKADPGSAALVKPWLRGRDLRRWRADWAGKYVIFTSRGTDIGAYPAIRDYLKGFKTDLEKRATAHLHPWYELQQPQEGIYPEFERPKIVWQDIAQELRFCRVDSGTYLANKAYFMPLKATYLLSLLNSSLTEFLVRHLTSSLRGGAIQGHTQYMERLSIVTPDEGMERQLQAMAEAGIAGEPVDNDELNDLVYDIYGLSRADRALIQEWFERRSLVR